MSKSDRIEDFELIDLLRRLALLEVETQLDDSVTVRDVCELTGESERRVRETLAEMREQDYRARVAQALRELEAPLYSVERPGFSQDPLAAWSRTQTLQKAFGDRTKR